MKYVFRLSLILVAAVAVWYFFLQDNGEEEVAEVVVELDPVQEYLSLNDAPTYINLGSVVAPIFKGDDSTGSLIVIVVLELTRASIELTVREQSAAVKDAMLTELYGASERFATYGEEPDVAEIKQRFRAASQRVLGEDVVADVLLQDFVHKEE